MKLPAETTSSLHAVVVVLGWLVIGVSAVMGAAMIGMAPMAIGMGKTFPLMLLGIILVSPLSVGLAIYRYNRDEKCRISLLVTTICAFLAATIILADLSG